MMRRNALAALAMSLPLTAAAVCDERAYQAAMEVCNGSYANPCSEAKDNFQEDCRKEFTALLDKLSKSKTERDHRVNFEEAQGKQLFIRRNFPILQGTGVQIELRDGEVAPTEPWDQPQLFFKASDDGRQSYLRADENASPGGGVQPPGDIKKPLYDFVSEVGKTSAGALQDMGKNGNTQGLNQVASRAIRENDAKLSEEALRLSSQIEPDNPQTLSLRSALRSSQGRYDEALADARAALKVDPDNALARDMEAYLKTTQRRIGLKKPLDKPDFGALLPPETMDGPGTRRPSSAGGPAGMEDGAARGSHPSDFVTARIATPAQLLMRSAFHKWRMGDETGALLDAARAIDLDPADSKLRSARAFLLNKAKQYGAALQDSLEALRLDPSDAQALREKAYAEIQAGDCAAALADLQRAITLEPRNALGYLYRAMALEKLGRLEEARGDYALAAQLDPGLKTLTDAALTRLAAGTQESSQPGLPVPWKPYALPGTIVLAALLLAAGTRRMLRSESTPLAAPAAVPTPASAPPSSVPGTLAPDSVLAGNFRILRELGRGGMGVVYAAEDLTLKRRVAVKQLGRAALETPALRERFLQEARTAAKLRHPHLAEIYSVAEEGGELYLVFEFVDGTPLDRLLAVRRALPLDQVRGILRGVCSALDHAHSQRIIHRDLKPANVMLEAGGGAKVMDFGIAHEARTMSDATQTAAWGTPPYMAPEQQMGRVSRESDLYALGVMTYELLTGCRPFSGDGMLDEKLGRRFPPAAQTNPTLPAGTDAFFSRALDPDPGRRFHSGAEFAAALDALDQRNSA